MNTRDYKKFVSGECYHVFNRGVAKGDIFKDENDYASFLERIRLILGFKNPIIHRVYNSSFRPRPIKIKPFPENSFEIISFCFMPNHFHLIIRQNGKTSISKFISKLCTSYSMYFNKKYERTGGLFQDIFKAVNVPKNNYLLWLSAYIHQNPAVAGLVFDLKRWKWSSYNEYMNPEGENQICNKSLILEQFKDGEEGYLKFIDTSFKAIKQKKFELNRGNDLFLD